MAESMRHSTTSSERSPLLARSGSSPPPASPQSSPSPVTEGDVPTKETSDRELVIILSGIYVAATLSALDGTLVATLSAPISTVFNNMPLLGWLASSFFIATTVSQPLAGKLSDIYGRREGLLSANAVFALGNLLCALAPAEWVLICGRVVAGLGGGAIGPLASMVMTDLVPLRRRGLWQGIANICYGIGSGLGGPVGGWVANLLGWRWAFALQIPISLLAMLLTAWKLESPAAKRTLDVSARFARIDVWGGLSLSVGLILLLLGMLTGGNQLPWTHWMVITALVLACVTFALFAYVETNIAQEPILPARLLQTRTIAASCLANWLHSMARFGLLFHLPIYLQVQGLDPASVGLRFVPEAVAICFASPLAGLIMQQTGKYYYLSLTTHALFVVGLGLFTTLQLDTPAWPPFVYVFITGVGFSGMLTTTLIALLAAADPKDAALAISASYAGRSTGGVLGIALASATFRNVLRPALRRAVGGSSKERALVRSLEKNLALLATLEPGVRERVQTAYMIALRTTFWTLFGLAVLGAIAGAFVKEHKLHSQLSRKPLQEQEGEQDGTRDE